MPETIVTIKFGSHLYGTNTPESDTDLKSVHIPDARDIVLQRVPNSVKVSSRKKEEREKNRPEDLDQESYSLQRYLELLADGQTVAVDMLFAPKSHQILSSGLWQYLQNSKDRFLSKKSTAFVGYCRTQANKYGIKGSRVASAKKAMEFFLLAVVHFGSNSKVGDMPLINTLFDDHTEVVTEETTPGRFETYFVCCDRMVGFKNTVQEAAKIFTKIYDQYGSRARMAETNDGIDWKALSHAVRVGQEAVELLKTGQVTFPLLNADHVKDIKQGKLPYKVVSEEIEELLVQVEQESAKSSLPEKPDYKFIDNLVHDVYSNEVGREWRCR
jgi:hypothetical protein